MSQDTKRILAAAQPSQRDTRSWPAFGPLRYALRLRGIRVHSRVGVSDAERALAQELVVAVDVELPGRLYPADDDLEQAADYAEVGRYTDDCAREHPYRLLETFALRVAQRLADRWPAAELVRVAVTKAIVPMLPATEEATAEVTLGKVRA